MNNPANAIPESVGEKRPDVALALDELVNSVTMLEELVGTLIAKLSPVCSPKEPAAGAIAKDRISACQVSGCVRDLDRRACALVCSVRYLLSALEV